MISEPQTFWKSHNWTFLLHEIFFFTLSFAWIFFLGIFPCMNLFLFFSPPPPHHFSNGPSLNSLQWSSFLGSYFNSKKQFKDLFFRSKNHPMYWGVKITPQKGVILYLKILLHFQSLSNSIKSKNNPIFGVILTPDWEFKELFFRSKNDPKKGLSCT